MAASAASGGEVFLYTEGVVVPEDVVRVRVHPSVTAIPNRAFNERGKLKTVELCEGLQEIGEEAFRECSKALKIINIPSTVTVIGKRAFYMCASLKNLEFSEGLEEIREEAFTCCISLSCITLPASIKIIGNSAFIFSSPSINNIRLPEGVESIGDGAFSDSSWRTFRIPPLISTLSEGLFGYCGSLVSVEISERIMRIKRRGFKSCRSLRNLVIPPNTVVEDEADDIFGAFGNCTDLLQVFGTQPKMISALKHRFDNLPIHKMIYYHSYNNLTSNQLNDAVYMKSGQRKKLRRMLGYPNVDPTGNQQDCLGMTPLHILACSTIQNMELYKVLVENCPENLIVEDKWGAVPFLYAVWADAPNDVIQFIVESYSSLHPKYEFDWSKLVIMLARANTSEVIEKLVKIQYTFFPSVKIDWNLVLEQLFDEMTESRKNKTRAHDSIFRFLVQCSVAKRIKAIGLKRIRENFKGVIAFALSPANRSDNLNRRAFLSFIESKLAEYESEYRRLKEATTILELSLWKTKLDESTVIENGRGRRSKKRKIDRSAIRDQFRVSCGADVVIENVLPYLLPSKIDPRKVQ